MLIIIAHYWNRRPIWALVCIEVQFLISVIRLYEYAGIEALMCLRPSITLTWLDLLSFQMWTFQCAVLKFMELCMNCCSRASVPSWICDGSHWTCWHMPWYPGIWWYCPSSRETQHKQTSRRTFVLRENLPTAWVSCLFMQAFCAAAVQSLSYQQLSNTC